MPYTPPSDEPKTDLPTGEMVGANWGAIEEVEQVETWAEAGEVASSFKARAHQALFWTDPKLVDRCPPREISSDIAKGVTSMTISSAMIATSMGVTFERQDVAAISFAVGLLMEWVLNNYAREDNHKRAAFYTRLLVAICSVGMSVTMFASKLNDTQIDAAQRQIGLEQVKGSDQFKQLETQRAQLEKRLEALTKKLNDPDILRGEATQAQDQKNSETAALQKLRGEQDALIWAAQAIRLEENKFERARVLLTRVLPQDLLKLMITFVACLAAGSIEMLGFNVGKNIGKGGEYEKLKKEHEEQLERERQAREIEANRERQKLTQEEHSAERRRLELEREKGEIIASEQAQQREAANGLADHKAKLLQDERKREIEALEARRAHLLSKAEAGKDALTTEEQTELNKLVADIKNVQADLEAELRDARSEGETRIAQVRAQIDGDIAQAQSRAAEQKAQIQGQVTALEKEILRLQERRVQLEEAIQKEAGKRFLEACLECIEIEKKLRRASAGLSPLAKMRASRWITLTEEEKREIAKKVGYNYVSVTIIPA